MAKPVKKRTAVTISNIKRAAQKKPAAAAKIKSENLSTAKRGRGRPAVVNDFNYHVPAGVLIAILNISHPTLTRYVRSGMPKLGPNQYDLRACIPWRIEQIIIELTEKGTVDNTAVELRRSQKKRIDLEIAQTRGKLVSIDLLNRVLTSMMSITATQLEALGPRVAPAVARLDDPGAVQDEILKEARATRQLITDEVEKFGELLAAEASTAVKHSDDDHD